MTNSKKISFAPIINEEAKILILGSLPSDKSLEKGEYYGHLQNKFWRVIATITGNELPVSYADKKQLLLKSDIGIWDVAHSAQRAGSMDSAIKDVEPNDINGLIAMHSDIKVIGFNGTKAQSLFDKHFTRNPEIRYILLPSTSPANAAISFDNLCKAWRQLLETV